ncbi:hypothetical protein BTVI_52665 [Pitangus sulphuratus]|nr:hypothetical protein BTVI_52665 [Pitangus sulphuratus]
MSVMGPVGFNIFSDMDAQTERILGKFANGTRPMKETMPRGREWRSRGSKDARVIDVLKTAEVSESGHAGTGASPPGKAAGLITHLKCIYTNAHSMGNKQKELEAIVQQENCDSCHHRDLVGRVCILVSGLILMLDDCTLQLSHNGTYLDLESTLAEQRDELEGFQEDAGEAELALPFSKCHSLQNCTTLLPTEEPASVVAPSLTWERQEAQYNSEDPAVSESPCLHCLYVCPKKIVFWIGKGF